MFGGWSLLAKFIAAGVMLLLLSGGGCLMVSKIKGCVRAEDTAAVVEKTAEKNQAVKEADQKSDQEIQEMTNEELIEYSHTGILPERLRRAHRP